MKANHTLKLMAVLGAGALASCASGPETVRMPVSASLHADSSLSGKILSEVNSYRRNKGKADLQRHPGLDRLAQEHCEYLRQHRGEFSLYGHNVSHFGFQGRALAARERYNMLNVGENIAAATRTGNSTATTLVTLWKNSKDHEWNMRGDWSHTGIGVVVDDDGTVFSTELFGSVSYSQAVSRERFNRF